MWSDEKHFKVMRYGWTIIGIIHIILLLCLEIDCIKNSFDADYSTAKRIGFILFIIPLGTMQIFIYWFIKLGKEIEK